ncbi:hypothetical protein LSAT2_026668 [Lamellibrachia satsuma]|nr:hypothetical protein LSAT2_026668 [Lamellibrachia satsuma]
MRKDSLPGLPLYLTPTKSARCPLHRSSIHLPSLAGDRNLAIVSQGLRMRYAAPKRQTWDPVIMKARNDFAYENYLLRQRMRCVERSLTSFRNSITDGCLQYRDTGIIAASYDDTLMSGRRRKPHKLPPFK